MGSKLKVIIAIAVLLPATLAAELNHIPQPWRQDAVVLGRDDTANVERYLHELSFGHNQPAPSAIENGIRGTGGSVGSRRLYLDFRFRQDFGFNENRQGFLLDIQRSEDFDGSYDRQLVGFRHQLTDATEVWLQGDVFADKSRSDVYFSGRHTFDDESWLHASWILPDLYFNDKTRSDDAFEDPAQSFFLQWHRPAGQPQQGGTTASVTYSPASTFDSRGEGLVVENETIRGALSHQFWRGHWQLRTALSGEHTRRYYNLDERASGTPTMRDHLRVEAEAIYNNHRLEPGIGLHYFYLREKGYTGRNLDEIADLRRREPVLAGRISLTLTPAVTLKPAIYLSVPDIEQTYSKSEDEDHHGFIGKFALPFEIVLSRKENAILTLAPTFYLHKAAFGGGNLQVHWPM
ncbi:hypothetical protein FDP08_10380 [Marinobacter panjinensis]|uniref:Alginate export domain-containing protein n=1 Tax=Marinobacter panjinensis TaxID=2576384 RepID=A0A4U6R4P9_9GAMM|nr:hypothetical protein [Marinobacter panjinensis]MCR8914728.1 hypothetical protein [Marinobacter panjinensis]TKV68461.1 hypothetical protein FDP08_10380 [Marinobacter panjinensis]